MAWNGPDDDKNGKDPWGKRGSRQQPPNLEEIWKKIRQQAPLPPGAKQMLRRFAGVIVFLGFLATGYYSVGEGSQAVILRFGKHSHTVGSGPHWRIPFIDTKIVVDVEQVRSYKREGMMLTRDENIVDIEFDVQYKIDDINNYVFTASDPDFFIQQASESALRQVIGASELDAIRTQGRETVAAQTKVQLQTLLNRYKVGLLVTQVNLQRAEPPEQVKDAFDDVIRAREDRERFINEAETYTSQLLPLAQGEAKRIGSEAEGYKESVTAEAEGKAQRFKKLLTEYEKSPDVTRERLYLESLETILGKTSKILIDGQNHGPLFYMPLPQAKRAENSVEESQQSTEKIEPQNREAQILPPDVVGMPERSRQRERGVL